MVETSTRQNLKDRPLRLADRAAAGEGQEYSFSISCKVIGTFFYTLTSTRRLSPSDGDSLGSDQSSGRESAEESTRPVVTPNEPKPQKKTPKNCKRHNDIIIDSLTF